MANLLGRLEIDAAQLWREHPPAIHNPAKQTLFELAGCPTRTPSGTVNISRWGVGELPPAGALPKLRSVDGPFTYPPPEAGVDEWHVNFADPQLFAFYGTSAFAQDEIQVAEHPLLASVRTRMLTVSDPTLPALTYQNGAPTPVLVRNVERWCAIDTDPELAAPYGIYGRKLQQASLEALTQAVTRLDGPRSNILAMCAPQGDGRYTADQIREVLATAVTAFLAVKSEAGGRRHRVYSGHWGTGAFGGNRVLMAAAQILAARCAGLEELIYHSLDNDGLAAFEEGKKIASTVPEATPFDALVTLLESRGFRWGRSDGN